MTTHETTGAPIEATAIVTLPAEPARFVVSGDTDFKVGKAIDVIAIDNEFLIMEG